MPLDAVERQQIQDWFDRTCPGHACPACGERNWTIGNAVGLPEVGAAPGAGWSNQVATGNLIPAVLRVCNSCGYLAHFSVQVLLERRP